MHCSRGFICLASALLASLAILPTLSAREGSAVKVEVNKTKLDFKVGKDLIATYLIDAKQSKPYFYPLNALAGVGITENGPSDHIHHRSAWFCHGDVIPEGLEVKQKPSNVVGFDFWSENKLASKIVCVKVGAPKIEGNRATVVTTNEWRALTGQKVLDETRTITFVHLGPNQNMIVLDIDLFASTYPITFGDTKEGSMGIRIKESIQVVPPRPKKGQKPKVENKKRGTITNAEGKINQKECWGRVSAWCDYSGPVGGGKTAGLTVFADPKNPIDSAWHARDYGLLAANPFGRDRHAKFPDRKGNNDLVKLKKGEHLKLRFGLYLHAGDVKEGKVAQVYKEFVASKGK